MVKDEAIRELMTNWGRASGNAIHPAHLEKYRAALSPQADKVLIPLNELREWYGSTNSACGILEHGSDDYINIACIRERLFDLIKEAGDA